MNPCVKRHLDWLDRHHKKCRGCTFLNDWAYKMDDGAVKRHYACAECGDHIIIITKKLISIDDLLPPDPADWWKSE